MEEQTPRDCPYTGRPHRVYVALTNHCNRQCPWCSMYSSPKGSTFISQQQFLAALPGDRTFELQLEGGEPTTHPQFWEFVTIARSMPNCSRLILCTNGVRLPRSSGKLKKWLLRLGDRFTIKVSINHHLLEQDPRIFLLARLLCEQLPLSDADRTLVLNVRLRKDIEFDEVFLRGQLETHKLSAWANIFYLQKYGLASDQQDWSEPFIVGDNFTLVNPDGSRHGTDLVTRSNAMRDLL